MIQLLKSLTENCKDLELLDIRDNFLSEEAVNEMGQLIKTHDKLKALNISDCNINETDNDVIISALEVTKSKIEKLGYNYAELNAH